MRILILTLADRPYWPIARVSNPNKAAYAAKHGYDFLSCSYRFWTQYPASMSKIPLITHFITDYDWIFWTDADSLIMNPDIKLESFINEGFELLAHHNQDGLNCGQMLIKEGALWDYIFDNFRKNLDLWAEHKWWEQGAIQKYSEGVNSSGYLPAFFNRMFPSGPEHNTKKSMQEIIMQHARPGDFIWHFAGIGGERANLRLELMKDLRPAL